VLGNIDAMSWALESIRPGNDLTIDQLLETHARLLAGTRLKERITALQAQWRELAGRRARPGQRRSPDQGLRGA